MDVFLRHLRRRVVPVAAPSERSPRTYWRFFLGGRLTRSSFNIWNSQAQLLYTNWLNYCVYQTTSYDIERVGE